MAISGSTLDSNVSATTATDRANKSSISIAKNMDTFLKILTTQLQHQSPLDPMDSNQFTQQLVQFASVEQSINQNQTLASMYALMQAQAGNAALGYLGNKATFDGSQSTSADGATVKWGFNAPEAGGYTMRVKDAGGTVVHEATATYGADQQVQFNWTTGRADGKPLGSSPYTLELYKGTGANATQVAVKGSGVVNAVDMANGQTYIVVNGQRVPASSVTRVETAQ